jgi:hypothetical protein
MWGIRAYCIFGIFEAHSEDRYIIKGWGEKNYKTFFPKNLFAHSEVRTHASFDNGDFRTRST